MPASRFGDEQEAVAGGSEVASGATHEDKAASREVSRALGRLPTDQREAFLMVVVHCMSYEEVAEVTGCAVDAAKSKVSRARRQLQTWLAGEVVDKALEMGSGGQSLPLREEGAEERFAAEAVDRMIAALDTATATVEAQLAELRRMRRAA